MKTIVGTATILPDGTITVQTETVLNLPPGEHRVLLVIEEPPAVKKRPPLKFRAYQVTPVPADFTFRREDLYDDDAR